MKSHIANAQSTEPREKVLSFPNAVRSSPAATEGETALDLVNQASEVIMSIEAQAADIEARARSLAREAGESLRIADGHIQSLEAALRAAEKDKHEANARAQETEDALKQALSRAQATEAENFALAQRVTAAEMRANKSQQTLTRVEDAIRTKLLKLPSTGVNRQTAAA